MNKPIIGIPAEWVDDKAGSATYQSRQKDIQAIISAGGIPLLLPAIIPLDEIPGLVRWFDGFYLAGGGDIEPALFGGADHERVYGINQERDAFELALVREVIDRDKPLLTVCRGMQVLNVACGGTLYVDIESLIPGADKHDWWPKYQRDKLVHDLSVTPGSRLAEILGVNFARTNSLHHQAVNQVGDGLRSVAFALDGVIEALEHPGKRFVVGVQWHPEWLQNLEPMRAIYRQFIQSCKGNDGTQK